MYSRLSLERLQLRPSFLSNGENQMHILISFGFGTCVNTEWFKN